jgi:hypothetical protein
MPLMTNNFTNCGSPYPQKNEQGPPFLQFAQNISPKCHEALRKSQERINTPKSMMKQTNHLK